MPSPTEMSALIRGRGGDSDGVCVFGYESICKITS